MKWGAAGRAAVQNMGGSGQETEENNWSQKFQKHKAIEFRGWNQKWGIGKL